MKIKKKKELCQVFGVSLTTIDAWLRKGMPHKITKNGGYEFELDAVIKWRESCLQKAKNSDNEYEAARTEKEVYRAKTAKLNYERLEGSLVYAKDVREAAFEKARLLRDQLLNIPNRIAPILAAEQDPKKTYEILEKEIRQCLETIAGDLNKSEVKNDANSN